MDYLCGITDNQTITPLARFLHYYRQETWRQAMCFRYLGFTNCRYTMKQIYYVIQTLLRGRGSNIIKIISFGIKPDDEVSCCSPAWRTSRVSTPATKTTTISTKSGRYLPLRARSTRRRSRIAGPVAGAILENFPEQVEAATSTCHWMNARYTMKTPVLTKER